MGRDGADRRKNNLDPTPHGVVNGRLTYVRFILDYRWPSHCNWKDSILFVCIQDNSSFRTQIFSYPNHSLPTFAISNTLFGHFVPTQ